MSPLKYASLALMILLYTTQAYAMRSDEDAHRPAAVSPRTQAEKDAFRAAITNAVNTKNASQLNDALIVYEPKDWFSQKAFEFVFISSAQQCWDGMTEYLLNRQGNRFPIGQDDLTRVFTGRQSDEVKISILNLVAQQDVRNPLLTQANLEELLPKAAARGRLTFVQRIFALPQDCFTLNDDCRKNTMAMAAGGGQLETVQFLIGHARDNGVLARRHLNEMFRYARAGYIGYVGGSRVDYNPQYKEDCLNTMMRIRNVVNYLLNMNDDGPDQETVDDVFANAAGYCTEVRLVKIMLMDRATEALRTGLRPSNRRIRDAQNSCIDPETSSFLNSLILPAEPLVFIHEPRIVVLPDEPEVIAQQPSPPPAPQNVVIVNDVAPKAPAKKAPAKKSAPKKAAPKKAAKKAPKKAVAKGPVKKGK